MPLVNFYDSDMFNMNELTTSVRRLPNMYNRIGSLGLFPSVGVRTRVISHEELNEAVNLLPSLPWGAPASVGHPDRRFGETFLIPHIPHEDAVDPNDVQDVRAWGSNDGYAEVATVVANKLQVMKNKIDLTLEYMRATALTGTVKDGAGTTLYNYYTKFDITQKVVDFVLGTAGTDVRGKIVEIKRDIENKARGATFTRIRALASPTFMDKLTKHATVADAFKYYQNNNQNLAGDYRTGFMFADVEFVEYNATVTLSDLSTTANLIADGDAIFYPVGTALGVTAFAPADFLETVNTRGQEYYSKSERRKFDRGIDLHVQSNPLPILTRPDLVARGHSSN